eukprot:scaffold538_cov412-Prasinococcus_capsulatus_cf.AAC.5
MLVDEPLIGERGQHRSDKIYTTIQHDQCIDLRDAVTHYDAARRLPHSTQHVQHLGGGVPLRLLVEQRPPQTDVSSQSLHLAFGFKRKLHVPTFISTISPYSSWSFMSARAT